MTQTNEPPSTDFAVEQFIVAAERYPTSVRNVSDGWFFEINLLMDRLVRYCSGIGEGVEPGAPNSQPQRQIDVIATHRRHRLEKMLDGLDYREVDGKRYFDAKDVEALLKEATERSNIVREHAPHEFDRVIAPHLQIPNIGEERSLEHG